MRSRRPPSRLCSVRRPRRSSPSRSDPTDSVRLSPPSLDDTETFKQLIQLPSPELAVVFDPPNIKAAKGDIINFLFNPKSAFSFQPSPQHVTCTSWPGLTAISVHFPDHSVTESLANDPCRRKQGGFDSGFNPVDPMNFNPANSPTFNITVDDPSIPQYAYCSQGLGTDKSHCERLGQSFSYTCLHPRAISPDPDLLLSALPVVAREPGPMLVTINAPDSGPGSLDEVKKAALATVLGAPPKNASGSASGGTIAMVGGGAAAAVASLAGVAFFFIRRRSLRKRGSYANVSPHSPVTSRPMTRDAQHDLTLGPSPILLLPQIDETTAPLGDRPELGEFSIPMHESTNRSSMAIGEGDGSGGRDSPAGQRPLLASRTSA